MNLVDEPRCKSVGFLGYVEHQPNECNILPANPEEAPAPQKISKSLSTLTARLRRPRGKGFDEPGDNSGAINRRITHESGDIGGHECLSDVPTILVAGCENPDVLG
jgi:hypothetical protein